MQSSSSEKKKKIGKTSKSCCFWAQFAHKKGVSMAHAQNEKKNCTEIRCCEEGARTYRKVKIPNNKFLIRFLKKSVGNMINHYNCWAFIILGLFAVLIYRFLFSRYLDLAERHFSSDILLPFRAIRNWTDSSNFEQLYSRD